MTEKQQPTFTATPSPVNRHNVQELRVGDVLTIWYEGEEDRHGTIVAATSSQLEVRWDDGRQNEIARVSFTSHCKAARPSESNNVTQQTKTRPTIRRTQTALTLNVAHELDVGDVLWFASPGGADVRGEVVAATSRDIEVKLDSGILVQWWRVLIPQCTVQRFTSEMPVAVVIDEGHLCTCLYSDGEEYVYESELHAALAHKVTLANLNAWEKIPRREYPSESAVLECGACPGDYVVLGDGTAEGEILSVLGPDHVLVRWQDDRSETELHIGAGDLVLRSGAAQRSREERASHE